MKRPPSVWDDIVSEVAVDSGITKAFTRHLAAKLLDEIRNTVWARGELTIQGFARFKVRHFAARDHALNSTMAPARRVVVVRAADVWRRRLD